MTNTGPAICPKCGATMQTSDYAGFVYHACPQCRYTFAHRGPTTTTADRYPPTVLVDEPHANMPPVDGALLCCILDDDMNPTTLDGTLHRCYTLREYKRQTVDRMNYYRERGVRLLLDNLWDATWNQ